MDRTTQVLQEGIGQGLHTAAQVCVMRGGQVVFDHALGEARPAVAMTNRTPVLWMSAGKPVTAIAVLQQVSEGRLSLDTRVDELIPEFGQQGKAPITVRHCLLHTAGFRGPLNNFAPGSWAQIIERCCLLKQEPGWVPGRKAGYHVGSSWFILGELLQRVDDAPFEALIRRRVFEKIGAGESWIGVSDPEQLLPRLALMWQTDKSPANHQLAANTAEGIAVPRPGANLLSTARQMASIYHSLLAHDGALLPAEWSRQMIARQREGMFDETFKQTVDWGYGLKLDSKRYGHADTYGYGPHASDQTFGHSGNQCSCAFADPAHDLVVAWVCTGMPGEPAHQARQNAINAAVYEDLGLAGERGSGKMDLGKDL